MPATGAAALQCCCCCCRRRCRRGGYVGYVVTSFPFFVQELLSSAFKPRLEEQLLNAVATLLRSCYSVGGDAGLESPLPNALRSQLQLLCKRLFDDDHQDSQDTTRAASAASAVAARSALGIGAGSTTGAAAGADAVPMTASRDTDPSAPRGRWTWHHHDHDNDHDHGGVGAQRRRRVLAVEFQRDLRPFFMVATSDDIQPCGQRTSAPSWSSRLVANLQLPTTLGALVTRLTQWHRRLSRFVLTCQPYVANRCGSTSRAMCSACVIWSWVWVR